MKKVIGVAILCLITAKSFADAPLPMPKSYRVCNDDISHCANISPDSGAVVYKIEGDTFSAVEAYRIPGWHRDVHLSKDGEYFMSGYGGLNLVSLDANQNTVILTIWKKGKKSHEITLGQILKTMRSLQRTVSHYYWGINEGLTYDGKFKIKTVEERTVLVNPETGEITFSENNKKEH